MKQVIRKIIFALIPRKRLKGDQASILMYHSISNRTDYFSAVTLKDFEQQMAYLKKANMSVIALSELVERLRSEKSLGGAIVITFDDGYMDNYTEVFPVLKKYEFPATIFVTTGIWGRKDKRGIERCSKGQLKEMQVSGLVDIEPHTVSHPKLATLSNDQARREIEKSKNALGNIREGKKCGTFAYPYGNYSKETIRLVKEMGFDAAVTVREGVVKKGDDMFALRRNSVNKSTSFLEFKLKVSQGINIYRKLKP